MNSCILLLLWKDLLMLHFFISLLPFILRRFSSFLFCTVMGFSNLGFPLFCRDHLQYSILSNFSSNSISNRSREGNKILLQLKSFMHNAPWTISSAIPFYESLMFSLNFLFYDFFLRHIFVTNTPLNQFMFLKFIIRVVFISVCRFKVGLKGCVLAA